MTTPVDVAGWVAPYWAGTSDRISIVAIAISRGLNTTQPGGVFGTGNTGDGPAQAAAAYSMWQAQGWKAFPDKGSGRSALYTPFAIVAVNAYLISQAGKQATTAATSAAAGASAVTDVPGAITGAVDKLTDGLAAVKWLTTPNAWVRITKVVVGIGLVFLGAGMISVSKIGTPITNLIKKADDTVARQSQLSP